MIGFDPVAVAEAFGFEATDVPVMLVTVRLIFPRRLGT